MATEVLVHVDLAGVPTLVGRLHAHARGNRESATFEYDRAWLRHEERFALDPALQLTEGPFHTGGDRPLFGALGDSAPDRWGRALMRRAERRQAQRAGEAPRTLREIDFLLGVSDEARAGALRFATTPGGPFLAPAGQAPVPPLVELPRLLAAAGRIADENETDEDLRLILAPGSSLGGARPKASVREPDGRLAMAKFPHRDDEWNLVLWEATALALAGQAGIETAPWRVESIAGREVLILGRFDRAGAVRIPFLSALSMLGAVDHESHSYLELADALRQQGAAARADLAALWRRIVFNILINNVDDHLRNHGFLYAGSNGWRLAPAYDLNPVPVDVHPRVLTTTITVDDGSASLDLALSVAGYFGLSLPDARAIAAEVGRAVAGWRDAATGLGIKRREVERMSSAFDPGELKGALQGALGTG